jgi:excisionase family DNA binding protein
MNDTVLRLHNDYLEKTSDKAAAASLTLADMMQSSLDARGEPVALPAAETPLTIKDVAARLGVAADKVYDLTAQGRLRHFRVGKSIRFLPADVEEYQQRAVAKPSARFRYVR